MNTVECRPSAEKDDAALGELSYSTKVVASVLTEQDVDRPVMPPSARAYTTVGTTQAEPLGHVALAKGSGPIGPLYFGKLPVCLVRTIYPL